MHCGDVRVRARKTALCASSIQRHTSYAGDRMGTETKAVLCSWVPHPKISGVVASSVEQKANDVRSVVVCSRVWPV